MKRNYCILRFHEGEDDRIHVWPTVGRRFSGRRPQRPNNMLQIWGYRPWRFLIQASYFLLCPVKLSRNEENFLPRIFHNFNFTFASVVEESKYLHGEELEKEQKTFTYYVKYQISVQTQLLLRSNWCGEQTVTSGLEFFICSFIFFIFLMFFKFCYILLYFIIFLAVQTAQ